LRWLPMVALCALTGCGQVAVGPSPSEVAGKLLIITDDGGWCWFQGPRAIVHEGRIIVGTVARGRYDLNRRGNVEVHAYDLATGQTQTSVLHTQFEVDDHDSPALLVRPDGRVLSSYAKHSKEGFHYIRITNNPGDISSWGECKTTPRYPEGHVTYSNLYRMSVNGLLYNFFRFFRGTNSNPFFLYSGDEGDSFIFGGRILAQKGRPYMKYASNGIDIIHFTTTDGHPRDYDNSIYHGYIKVERVDGKAAEKLYDSYGNLLDSNLRDDQAVGPSELTRIFEGGPRRVGWTSSIQLDKDGNPYVGFTVQMNSQGLPAGSGGQDHRFHYARFDGASWHEYEIAYGGSRLYPGEDDYTGLIEVDPGDRNTVFIGTDADPVTGKPLISMADSQRHRELYRGQTEDGGRTWKWEAITRNSAVDNVRPIALQYGSNRTVVLWLRGKMTSYTNYDFRVVGLVLGDELPALTVATDAAASPSR
jgi:BNR repeat-containing family member